MYLDDIYVGMEIDTGEVEISREKMIAFSREYDPLPIHLDDDYAASTRFGSLIAPGVMSFMAVWSQIVKSGVFDDALIAGKSTAIEWFKPVYPGDVLHGTARVTRIERRNPYNGIAETTLEVYNQNLELVLKNITESIIKYKTSER